MQVSTRSRRPVPKRAVRLVAVLGAPVLAATTLTACGGSSDPANTITLYSGQHEQTTQALVSAFEQKTGIHVNVRYNDEDTFADEIVTEQSHPIADVFYTENSPALEFLQGKDLLAPVTPSTLSATPSKYDSPQGDWVGASARVSVIVYNPSLISASQLPTSVAQLSDPKYQGKLGLAPSETDFQPVVASVEKTLGPNAALTWLKGVKANAGSHSFPDNETLVDRINRGSVAFGVLNQYYWYRLRAEDGAGSMHSAVAFLAPHDPGYVIDVSGAGVLKSSKNQTDAQKFLGFLVSQQGQQIIANSDSFEYPLNDGVAPAGGQPAFSSLRPNPISLGELGDGSAAVSLLQQAGML